MTSPTVKLLLIAGARPNFMKVAPLIWAIQASNASRVNGVPLLDWRLVHTGQHYDTKMSDIFFQELGIPAPDINLDVGSGSHAVQTAQVMTRFEPVCLQEKPDWLVVVGDVNSTLACTLVAAKLGIKVAHIEAGLRSYDRAMPEEINRIVTDALADLLLTPSEDASDNLRRESVPDSKIRLTGNIMIDTLVRQLPLIEQERVLERLGLRDKGFFYVTLHRPSNVDCREALTVIVQELARLSEHWPIVFPIHPRTVKRLQEFGLSFDGNPGIRLLEPVGYHESIALTRHARCVLTDSGGLQEESTYLRTPCLTLRPNTERPVTVTLGSNKLTSIERLREDLDQVLAKPDRFGQIPPLWDGHTAERIVEALTPMTRTC